MRRPESPPNTLSLLHALTRPDEVAEVLARARDLAHEDRYLHWNELRHRTPPGGLSHENWWLALKLRRLGNLRELPLEDTAGNRFRVGLTGPIQELLHYMDTHLAGSVGMPEELANVDQRNRYLTNSLIEEAVRSSQLEGAATTRRVAKEMIQTGRRPSSRSEQMVLNNYRAMERIRELRSDPLELPTILELQRIVTFDALDDPSASGRLRTADEDVRVVANSDGTVLHTPPPAGQIEARLRLLCQFANDELSTGFFHPVLRAIVLHFWLAYDHPFVDGNGRAARALFYWSLLRSGYWLAEFVSISHIIAKRRAQYARAFLHSETDECDLTYFAIYHLEVVQEATEALRSYIRRKSQEVRQLEAILRSELDVNHRQRALLSKALRTPGMEFTVKSHQSSHRVVYETARTDLLDLVNSGLLLKRKRGREFVFRAPDDLEERLQGTNY